METYWLPDYYWPSAVGNRWVYDGRDWDGDPAQMEVRIDDLNFPFTCFSGTTPVSSYIRNAIKVRSAYGSYDSDTGDFYSFDDWDEYITVTNGWGIFGSEDSPESIRIDQGFIITNRIAVGQTVAQTKNFYLSGVYKGKAILKLQLLNLADVTVPAGTFPGCLHLRISLSVGGMSQAHDEWWDRSVGMVKKKGISGDGAAQSFELIDFSVVSAALIAPEAAAANPSMARDLPLQFECGKGSLSVAKGNFQMRLNGPVGAAVVVESSSDLLHWVPIQTNTVPVEGLLLSVPMNQQSGQFFRAVIVTKQ